MRVARFAEQRERAARVLAIVGIIFLDALHSAAQVPMPPFLSPVPPPVALNVPQIAQTTPVWCWLAVAEMAIRYRNLGGGLSQCQMLEVGYTLPSGSCCATPTACMRTGGLQEIQAVIGRFGRRLSVLGPTPSPTEVYSFLRQGHPVIAALQNTPFSGHVVLIRGMRIATVPIVTPFGMQTQTIPVLLVNDPMSHFVSEVSYAAMLGYWSAAIVVL